MLLIKPNFVPSQFATNIITTIQQLQTEDTTPYIRFYPTRTEIAARSFRKLNPDIFNQITEVRQQVLDSLKEFYSVQNPLYIDFTLITEMRDGDSHPLHADNERQEGGEWFPNHTYWRQFTGLLYLNDSGATYEGGIIKFPSLNLEITPKNGLLIGFECDHKYEHEVTQVISGKRYAMSFWLTNEIEHMENW